jgi:hypothetical protein
MDFSFVYGLKAIIVCPYQVYLLSELLFPENHKKPEYRSDGKHDGTELRYHFNTCRNILIDGIGIHCPQYTHLEITISICSWQDCPDY